MQISTWGNQGFEVCILTCMFLQSGTAAPADKLRTGVIRRGDRKTPQFTQNLTADLRRSSISEEIEAAHGKRFMLPVRCASDSRICKYNNQTPIWYRGHCTEGDMVTV
jgi:hypothetical protein